MIRLAIVRQQYNPQGGAERFAARALQALAETASIDITLLARRWQAQAGWHLRKIDPPYLTRTGRDRSFARAAAACFGEYDLVQSHERIPGAAIFRAGDGVHASWLEQLGRTEPSFARVLRAMSRYHRYVLAAEAALFRHPSLRCVICNSRMVADDIERRFGVARDKLALIYNGVDTAVFHPDLVRFRGEWRQGQKIPEHAPLLAYVGAGFVRKNLAMVLAAIAPHDGVHLAVAGSDKKLRHYRHIARRLGIGARVHFLGAVQDIRPVYGAADAVILPSLYDPFPNVCVEAMAAGLPVFTSPTCGAAEWVHAGETGWVVDALDLAGYRTALGEWLAARSRWPQMRAAARATAEPHTLARMADELKGLYARVLGL